MARLCEEALGLPSLTYNDAVEEALCFGWIDSKINPIDDAFYMQVFTPRKLKSAWSTLNKARVERLLAAGLMTPAGLAMVKAAKDSGTWNAMETRRGTDHPARSGESNQGEPRRQPNWVSYSASRRKGVLYRLAGAKRPDTRARYLQDIIENMARNMSHAERMEKAGFRPKPKSSRRAKR